MANKTLVGITSVLLIVGSVAWGYHQYMIFNPMSPEIAPHNARRMSPERRSAFLDSLNLSADQKTALNGLEGRERFSKLQEILTPEQKGVMERRRMERDARRDERLRAAIPAADYARYKQKSAERRRSRPERSRTSNS